MWVGGRDMWVWPWPGKMYPITEGGYKIRRYQSAHSGGCGKGSLFLSHHVLALSPPTSIRGSERAPAHQIGGWIHSIRGTSGGADSGPVGHSL